MTAKKPNEKSKDDHWPKEVLKAFGGSESAEWNTLLANQVINTLWNFPATPDDEKKKRWAALKGLVGILPRDECEGMIATQLIACHYASWNAIAVQCSPIKHLKDVRKI